MDIIFSALEEQELTPEEKAEYQRISNLKTPYL